MEKFISSNSLNTAVLFLVFNRLDTTKQVFEAIRESRPPRLYIAADGARKAKAGEEQKVKEIREYVISNVDWECEVETLFREQNLGCKIAVSGAIDWFFENEEMGIILEDDCLPSQSFFWFCEELLERYKEDMRVGQISGDNFQKGVKRGESDYYFSIYNHIWGWATWRDRWKEYDVSLAGMEDVEFLWQVFNDTDEKKYWEKIFYKMKNNQIDTWDYQWSFALWNVKMLTITPNINLVKNIGFGVDATHTKLETKFSNLKTSNIIVSSHPRKVVRNYEADRYIFLLSKPSNVVVRIFKFFFGK